MLSLTFTTQCGSERQHTVRARPQQNGVAKRANRVLSERLTTMLDESGLHKLFWGECLAALVHVWNRCPTEAVRSASPHFPPTTSHHTLMTLILMISQVRTTMKPREWWKLSNAQLDDEVDDNIEDAEMGYNLSGKLVLALFGSEWL
jgi:hypothetical protein